MKKQWYLRPIGGGDDFCFYDTKKELCKHIKVPYNSKIIKHKNIASGETFTKVNSGIVREMRFSRDYYEIVKDV